MEYLSALFLCQPSCSLWHLSIRPSLPVLFSGQRGSLKHHHPAPPPPPHSDSDRLSPLRGVLSLPPLRTVPGAQKTARAGVVKVLLVRTTSWPLQIVRIV